MVEVDLWRYAKKGSKYGMLGRAVAQASTGPIFDVSAISQ